MPSDFQDKEPPQPPSLPLEFWKAIRGIKFDKASEMFNYDTWKCTVYKLLSYFPKSRVTN